ncbi:MAG: hypothetical protein IPK58_22145 [Acidobacteria bacterium]|nr:hypothetical protein [Acidobacteriota bacterium]
MSENNYAKAAIRRKNHRESYERAIAPTPGKRVASYDGWRRSWTDPMWHDAQPLVPLCDDCKQPCRQNVTYGILFADAHLCRECADKRYEKHERKSEEKK